MSTLADLFPPGDYRFHLTLRKGDAHSFFAAWGNSGALLAERRKWLQETPARYAALLPEGKLLLEETAEVAARDWDAPGINSVVDLGARLEPDILLLFPDETGAFRLRGGALCFPTGWALEEKLGHTLDFIHGVVPGLNAALAPPIQQFLTRLRPGVVFHRDNWGISVTDELNLHPARAMPSPTLPIALERLWLRVEYQALLALPRTKGIIFGIRIGLHRLDELAKDRDVAARLRHALASMPPEMAEYKRLSGIREKLIECV
ncbi:MAG: hypothetical protein JWM35_2395 [Verrucomicrobia bacterium]|nr:hypothetical protein [Verrucomicrobiota bacterium]